MKNFQITDKDSNKKYWISRSMCTCVIPLVVDENNNLRGVIASKRGSASPNNVGKWNCPCGYLDYDETTQECAKREFYEEIGLNLPVENFKFVEFNDHPDRDKLQNVTFRYVIEIDFEKVNQYLADTSQDLLLNTALRGGELNEVEEIVYIPMEFIHHFDWAFNHEELINRMADLRNNFMI